MQITSSSLAGALLALSKGITRSVTFPATINVTGDSASLDAELSFNRRELSLDCAGMPNDMIRDDVLIKPAIGAKKAA